MQTFLPYADFKQSASCLDNKRLNKQILEAKTIYDIISENRTSGGWVSHPVTRMWRGYAEALALYINACLDEWKINRKRNHSYEKIRIDKDSKDIKLPSWLGKEELHASHRSNLLRKDPLFYGKFGWSVKDDLEYYWPS